MDDLELSAPGPPWMMFISEAPAVRLGVVHDFAGLAVRLDGRAMSGPTPAFTELARGLRFPEYFGYNWDALHECLGDVRSWLHEDAVLVVVENSDALVTTAHLPTLVDVIASGCERAGADRDDDGMLLDRSPTALHFVFLVDKSLLKETAIRLRKSERTIAASTDGYLGVW